MESIKSISNSSLHHLIITSIVKHGRAPIISEMAERYQTSISNVIEALHALQDYHGVVLHPNNDEIWVCHPFSLAPTNFHISGENGTWYGTCAWCSLGASKLVGGNVTIKTMLADTGEFVELNKILLANHATPTMFANEIKCLYDFLTDQDRFNYTQFIYHRIIKVLIHYEYWQLFD